MPRGNLLVENVFIAGALTSADDMNTNFTNIINELNAMKYFAPLTFETHHFKQDSVDKDKILIDVIEGPDDPVHRDYVLTAGPRAQEIFRNNNPDESLFGPRSDIVSEISVTALVWGRGRWGIKKWDNEIHAEPNTAEQAAVSGFLVLNANYTALPPYRIRVHSAATSAAITASRGDAGTGAEVIYQQKMEGDASNNLHFNAVVPIQKDQFWLVEEQTKPSATWGDSATSYIDEFFFVPVTTGQPITAPVT